MNSIKDIIWRLTRDLAEALNAWTVSVPHIDYEYNYIVLEFYNEHGDVIMDYALYLRDIMKITDDVSYMKLLYNMILKHYE